MSSEAERLTQERIIETYTKNKIHTICVKTKGANDLYVIWVKMSDLQQSLVHQNLCHVAMKKTKYPTKEQVKKCKRKMSK